jgi:hypothetical protein
MNIYLDNKVCVCVWSNIGRWNEGSMYVLIDTFILWRMSLAAMSEWFGFGKTVDLTWVVNEWMMKMMERQFQLYLFMASADSFHLWGWKRQLYSTAFLSFLSQQTYYNCCSKSLLLHYWISVVWLWVQFWSCPELILSV